MAAASAAGHFIPVRQRPGGWTRELLGVLAAAALVLIAFHGVAFQGKTLDTSAKEAGVNGNEPSTGVATVPTTAFQIDPGASAWAMLPWAHVTARELSSHEVPTWDPYAGAGAPLAANGQSSVFDPLMLAMDLHPTDLVWDLSLLLAFVIAAVATYLFLRNLGLSMLAALAGTGAFIMSGFFVTMENNSFIREYVYLPVLFGLVDEVVRSPKLRWVGGLGAAVAGTILVGMPEAIFLVIGAAGLYALFRIASPPNGVAAAGRVPVALRLAGGGVLGLALAAPFLVLLLGYLPYAYNSHSTGLGVANAPFGTLLNWFIPLVDGHPGAQRVQLVTDRSWLGAAGAVLVVAAIAAPRTMRRFSGWFFLALAVLILLKVHGVPILQLAGDLPIVNRVNLEVFAPPVASFGLAVVVAVAVEALSCGEVVARRFLAGLCAVAVLLGALALADRRVLAHLPHASPLRQYALYAVALAAGGAVSVAVLGATWLPRFRSALAPAAVVVLLFELLALFGQGSFTPRANPYQSPPWLAMVTSGLSSTPEARVFGLDRVLYPNTAGVFGIEDIRTLDALYVSRYRTFIRDFVSPTFTDRFTGDGMRGADLVGNPAFNLLGVKYVLTGPTASDPSPEQLPPGQYSLIGTAGGIAVYKNNAAVARAFVATSVHRASTLQGAVSYLRALGLAAGAAPVSGEQPGSQAVAEGSPAQLASVDGPAPVTGTARSVRIVGYTADAVRLEVGVGAAGLLVLTDTYMPGWQATVNGRAAAVLPVDVAFRGVVVGSGSVTVVFSYHPPRELWGITLAVLGLVAFAAAAGVNGLRARQSRMSKPGEQRAVTAAAPIRRPSAPPPSSPPAGPGT